MRLTRSGSIGQESVVGLRGPGELLGVREVLSALPCQVSVETLAPSVLCAVRREAFLDAVRDCRELAMRLLGQLSKDLLLAEEQLVARAHLGVRPGTARLLLALVKENRVKARGSAVPDARRSSGSRLPPGPSPGPPRVIFVTRNALPPSQTEPHLGSTLAAAQRFRLVRKVGGGGGWRAQQPSVEVSAGQSYGCIVGLRARGFALDATRGSPKRVSLAVSSLRCKHSDRVGTVRLMLQVHRERSHDAPA